MATITSTPGGRRASSIAPAPSYAGVVSKYSSEIASAIANENLNRINQLVLDWQKGTLTWEDFLTKYQQEMDAQPEGSSLKIQMGGNLLNYQAKHKEDLVNQKRTELTAKYSADGSLSKLDEYNVEREILGLYEPGSEDYNKQLDGVTGLYDKAIDESIDNKRTELLDKYMGGGVSPQEQLLIVDELLKVAPQGSTAYNNLVGEKAQIETNIANSSSGENTSKAAQAYEFAQYQETNDLIPNYETGRIDGLTADQTNLDNWKNVQALMQGIKGQVEGKTIAYVNSKVADLEKQVNLRNEGKIFDTYVKINKQGDVAIQPVNVLDIIEGRDVGAINKIITPEINKKGVVTSYNLTDPRTGKIYKKFMSESAAMLFADKEGIPGAMTIKTKDGDVAYSYDKGNNNFVKIDESGNPLGVYTSIPGTPEQENLFKVQAGELPQSGFNQFTSKLGTNIKNTFNTAETAAGNFADKVGLDKIGLEKPTGDFGERAATAAKNAAKFTPQGLVMSGLKGLLNFKGSADNPAVQKSMFSGFKAPSWSNSGSSGRGSNLWGNVKNTISSGVNKAGNWFKGLFS